MGKRALLPLVAEILTVGLLLALVGSIITPPGFWSSQHGGLSVIAIILLSVASPFVRQGPPQTVRPWLRLLSGLVSILGIAAGGLTVWLALGSNQVGAYLTLGALMLAAGLFFAYAAVRGRSVVDRRQSLGGQSDA